MSLTEFLLARIAEDEELSRWGRLHDDPADPESLTKMLRWDDARLAAECEAKRRIVEGMRDGSIDDMFAPEILGALTLPYADHPDYQQEWAP
jgi:Family of unknown function (DUF6221)